MKPPALPHFKLIAAMMEEVRDRAVMERFRRRWPIIGPLVYRSWRKKQARANAEKHLQHQKDLGIIESYEVKSVKWHDGKPHVYGAVRLSAKVHTIQLDLGVDV